LPPNGNTGQLNSAKRCRSPEAGFSKHYSIPLVKFDDDYDKYDYDTKVYEGMMAFSCLKEKFS